MIQVRHLSKSFDGIPAVRDLSFDAPDGTITGVLGANGAGKTTTLRMIAGVLNPDRGTISVGGLSVTDNPAATCRVRGALLDHQGLYSRLTVNEHLAYFGRLRGVPSNELEDRVARLAEMLGLTTIADRRVGGFSQGERLKVALGCAMIHTPRHLLLDEPTNGLDVPTVRALRSLLGQLRQAGTCVLFSSHVLGEVEALCDRVVIVDRGAAIVEGTLAEVKGTSASATLEDAFVALTQKEIASC